MVLTPCSGCHPRACPNDIRTSWDGEARLLPHPTLSSRHPMSGPIGLVAPAVAAEDAKAIGPCRARTEEHTSELQSLMRTSYAVVYLKKQKTTLLIYTQISYITSY